MAKVEVSAHELTDAQVNFISLVKRGANRIPFRIQKKDDHAMFDLSRVFRRKAEQLAPAVLAAVVVKGADLDVAKDRLAKSGLRIDVMEEQDDVFLFPQAGVQDTGHKLLLKLDDEMALMLTGLTKSMDDYNVESLSFMDVRAVEGFRPSLHMAFDMLRSTCWNIMNKAENPSQVASALTAAIDEFKAYVGEIASAIPVSAFKADVTKGERPVETTKADEIPAETTKADEISVETAKTAKTDEPSAAAETTASEGADVVTETPDPATADPALAAAAVEADEVPAPVAAPAADTAVILKGIEAMLEAALAGVTQTFTTQIESVSGRVDELGTRVTEAEQAVVGTVGGVSKNDSVHRPTSNARKGGPPLLDTAYARR